MASGIRSVCLNVFFTRTVITLYRGELLSQWAWVVLLQITGWQTFYTHSSFWSTGLKRRMSLITQFHSHCHFCVKCFLPFKVVSMKLELRVPFLTKPPGGGEPRVQLINFPQLTNMLNIRSVPQDTTPCWLYLTYLLLYVAFNCN